MAAIPKRFSPLPPPPPPARVAEAAPSRNVFDLPPQTGYLAREIERLPQAGALHGDEDFPLVRDGTARRGNMRDVLDLARRGIDKLLADERPRYGGGGRHTYENSVARAPDATPTGGDRLLIVRAGRAYSVDAADLASGVTPPRTFVLSIAISGKPSNAEDIECHLFVDDVTFPAGFTGSLAKAGTAATASTVFSILLDEVQVGTVTFAIGATTGTFAMAAELDVLTGQQIDLLCPATADATLADIKITLRGVVA